MKVSPEVLKKLEANLPDLKEVERQYQALEIDESEYNRLNGQVESFGGLVVGAIKNEFDKPLKKLFEEGRYEELGEVLAGMPDAYKEKFLWSNFKLVYKPVFDCGYYDFKSESQKNFTYETFLKMGIDKWNPEIAAKGFKYVLRIKKKLLENQGKENQDQSLTQQNDETSQKAEENKAEETEKQKAEKEVKKNLLDLAKRIKDNGGEVPESLAKTIERGEYFEGAIELFSVDELNELNLRNFNIPNSDNANKLFSDLVKKYGLGNVPRYILKKIIYLDAEEKIFFSQHLGSLLEEILQRPDLASSLDELDSSNREDFIKLLERNDISSAKIKKFYARQEEKKDEDKTENLSTEERLNNGELDVLLSGGYFEIDLKNPVELKNKSVQNALNMCRALKKLDKKTEGKLQNLEDQDIEEVKDNVKKEFILQINAKHKETSKQKSSFWRNFSIGFGSASVLSVVAAVALHIFALPIAAIADAALAVGLLAMTFVSLFKKGRADGKVEALSGAADLNNPEIKNVMDKIIDKQLGLDKEKDDSKADQITPEDKNNETNINQENDGLNDNSSEIENQNNQANSSQPDLSLIPGSMEKKVIDNTLSDH